ERRQELGAGTASRCALFAWSEVHCRRSPRALRDLRQRRSSPPEGAPRRLVLRVERSSPPPLAARAARLSPEAKLAAGRCAAPARSSRGTKFTAAARRAPCATFARGEARRRKVRRGSSFFTSTEDGAHERRRGW